MNMEITEVMIVAVIVGLVEIAKGLGLPIRLAPVLSIILGIAAGAVYLAPGDLKMGVMELSAASPLADCTVRGKAP